MYKYVRLYNTYLYIRISYHFLYYIFVFVNIVILFSWKRNISMRCSDKSIYKLHKHQLFENKRGYSLHLFAIQMWIIPNRVVSAVSSLAADSIVFCLYNWANCNQDFENFIIHSKVQRCSQQLCRVATFLFNYKFFDKFKEYSYLSLFTFIIFKIFWH